MKTKETILAPAAEIIAQRTVRQDKDSYGTLITIDPDGSPVPTTISPSRSEGINWITFCTGRGASSAVRIAQDNKAAVCLNSSTYHISLTGAAEVCTDPEICREMWYEGLANHFSGPDDPNLCVIRFTTQRYSLFVDWELGDCETISASDGTGQYIQKRAPMQWQVALILYILPIPCSRKEVFRKRLGLGISERRNRRIASTVLQTLTSFPEPDTIF